MTKPDRAPAPLASPLSDTAESRPGLLRVLGPGMALAMVVGNVIGAGIFMKPGEAAGYTGSFPLIMAAWIVGGVLCILGALCIAELAVMLPRAGGLYVYLREAYGRPVGFLFGWNESLFGRPASIGALATGVVNQLNILLASTIGGKTQISTAGGVFVSVLLIFAMAGINIVGVIWGGRTQALTTIIKAGFLFLLGALPFLLMFGGGDTILVENYSTTITPRYTSVTAQFAAALLAVMWAYNGWHGIAPIAEEVRDPNRNIPLALFGGVGLLIFLYVLANVAYFGVLPMNEVKEAGIGLPQAMVQRLLVGYGTTAVNIGVAIVCLVAICSMLGAINPNIMNGPRVMFAMGRDEVFFRSLGRVHVNYRTPALAIAVQALMSALLVIAAGVLVTQFKRFEEKDIFQILTDYVIFSASIFYMLAVGAVIVLRIRFPHWERQYRTPCYPWVPLAYLLFYCGFLYYVYLDKPDESLMGVILIVGGLPAYYAYQAWRRRHPEVLHDGM